MTLRDVLVQLGFLMVTGGVMLGVWALLSGRLRTRRTPRKRDRSDRPAER